MNIELPYRCDYCGGALEMRWGYPRCIKCGAVLFEKCFACHKGEARYCRACVDYRERVYEDGGRAAVLLDLIRFIAERKENPFLVIGKKRLKKGFIFVCDLEKWIEEQQMEQFKRVKK